MKMPEKFEPLATYNGEVARGIMHTEDYQCKMAKLQDEFNEWTSEMLKAAGYVEYADGFLIKKR